MKNLTTVRTRVTAGSEIEFFLAFTRQKEVDNLTNKVAPLMKEDGVLWFAYPKEKPKKYVCEFNRDSGRNELGKHGFEGVRMVAIDEDWSALRFRKVENIKIMTRSFAMTKAGRKKVAMGKEKYSAK